MPLAMRTSPYVLHSPWALNQKKLFASISHNFYLCAVCPLGGPQREVSLQVLRREIFIFSLSLSL